MWSRAVTRGDSIMRAHLAFLLMALSQPVFADLLNMQPPALSGGGAAGYGTYSPEVISSRQSCIVFSCAPTYMFGFGLSNDQIRQCNEMYSALRAGAPASNNLDEFFTYELSQYGFVNFKMKPGVYVAGVGVDLDDPPSFTKIGHTTILCK